MGFPRQEFWNGFPPPPFPPPGDLPDPGIEYESIVSPALAVGFFTSAPRETGNMYLNMYYLLKYNLIQIN